MNKPAVEEQIVRLMQGDDVLFEWRCTPSDLDALVIGRLYAEGWIESAHAAGRIELTSEDEVLIARVQNPVRAQGDITRLRERLDLPHGAAFMELYRNLFARADAAHPDGGMHSAGLAASGRIAFHADDVGRHNTIDKVIGMALLAGAAPARHGLLISARVSGEIARKAALSGIAWLASRSIPTTLAVRIARTHGLPLIGRAASKRAVMY